MLFEGALSEIDLAKYTFTSQAASIIESLVITVNDLVDPSFKEILERARIRVEEAIKKGLVEADLSNPLVEFTSYPVAIMFVKTLGDRFLFRRYATAEAKRASTLLEKEPDVKLVFLAQESFKWRIHTGDAGRYLYLHFIDYLHNVLSLRDAKWKLINRTIRDGYVRINKFEAARLMENEVEKRILDSLLTDGKLKLPKQLEDYVKQIKITFEENLKKIKVEALPSQAIMEAFPPCMGRAYEGLLSGRRASHMERFALTSFLVNIGMDIEKIIKLFISVSDFDEEFTRYQVEHIAGLRGGRTKYTPPTCLTLRTHGLCISSNDICRFVKHPLSYYRTKVKSIKRSREETRESPESSERRGQDSS